MPLLSQRGYARHRGVTLRAVQKAIEAGRISLIEGKIDPEVADIQWDKNTDRAQAARAASQRAAPPSDASRSGAQFVPPLSIQVRDRVETARAELFELELAEKRGELVKADDVRKAAFEKARIARSALMTLPDRVSQLVAAESDASRCHAILDAEVRRICEEISAGEVAVTRN